MLVLLKDGATIRAGENNGDAMFRDDAAPPRKWFLMFQ